MILRRFLLKLPLFFVVKVAVDLILRPLFHNAPPNGWLVEAAVWAVVMAAVFALFPKVFSPKVVDQDSE